MMSVLNKNDNYHYAWIGLFFITLTLLYYFFGAIPVKDYGHDIIYMLDWVQRVDLGQVPHNDFQSILGAGFIYICRFFLKLEYYDLFGFSVANIFITTCAMGSAFALIFIAKFTQKTAVSCLFSIFVLIFIISCGYGSYHLGIYKAITYANIYNRWGYALLTPVFLQLFLIKEHSRVSSVILGLLIGLLFLIKSNYAYTGLGFLLLSFLHDKRYPDLNIAILMATALAVIFVFLYLTDIKFALMLRDYSTPIWVRLDFTTQNPQWIWTEKIWPFPIPIFILVTLFLFSLHLKCSDSLTVLSFCGLSALAFLLDLTSYGFTDIPLLSLVVIFSLSSLKLLEKKPWVALFLLGRRLSS